MSDKIHVGTTDSSDPEMRIYPVRGIEKQQQRIEKLEKALREITTDGTKNPGYHTPYGEQVRSFAREALKKEGE